MHDEKMKTSGNADPLAAHIASMRTACYALQARRTANIVAKAYNHALASASLEITQFSTLCAIGLGSATSVSDLATGLGVDRSTLVRNLARLKQLDLIAREEQGRRVRHVLKPAGRKLLERTLPIWQNIQTGLDEALATEPGSDDPRQSMTRLRHAARSRFLMPPDTSRPRS